MLRDVYTDWLLIRRLAIELEGRFSGARVRDVGQLVDGRFALLLWKRGADALLCIDIFAATPVITVESGELPITVEPGFVRSAGAALRGTTLAAVKSRTGDRLLRFEFASRSRFGVEERLALICELVPRFGNIVLLKGEIIVDALKEFAPSENAVRSIQTGQLYEAPPVRTARATPLLSDAQVEQLVAHFPAEDPLYVYRENGALVQAHLVELPKFADLEHTRADSLLEVFAQARTSAKQSEQSDRIGKQRRALERSLADRERKLRAELAQVEKKLADVEKRESLREQGEAIYARLHELAQAEQDAAKDEAAKLFARYKKIGASLDHLTRRRADLLAALDDLAQVRWEVERCADAQLDEAEQAVAALEPQQQQRRAASSVSRKRKPLQFRTPAGSRIFVGRTPLENADLTFRVARPEDLWFHVQGQPGAHVILARDDRTQAPQEDILAAAALAALHSKAKSSPKVTVDYTQRKHVRKRPAAAPGLVFYTHPQSVYVAPALTARLEPVE